MRIRSVAAGVVSSVLILSTAMHRGNAEENRVLAGNDKGSGTFVEITGISEDPNPPAGSPYNARVSTANTSVAPWRVRIAPGEFLYVAILNRMTTSIKISVGEAYEWDPDKPSGAKQKEKIPDAYIFPQNLTRSVAPNMCEILEVPIKKRRAKQAFDYDIIVEATVSGKQLKGGIEPELIVEGKP